MANTKAAVAKKKPVSVHEMTKAQYTWNEMKKNYVAYLLLAPFYLIFTVFTVAPVILSLVLSFTSFNMLEPPKWLFMDNYVRLFLDDDIFLLALKNTLIFAAITGPVSYLLSLMFAWFINELSLSAQKSHFLLF